MIYKRGNVYYVEFNWRGFGRHKYSTGTGNKHRAQEMQRMLKRFRDDGRRDLLGLLIERKLHLPELYYAWHQNPAALEHLKAKAESPHLGDLVEEWFQHCLSPAGISPRTKRRYAPKTIQRYRVSWQGFFDALPNGRSATLTDLTRGFVLDYRRTRRRAQGGRQRVEVSGRPLAGATLNKDLAALGAFMTWAQDVKNLDFERPKLPRERESSGRERWLSADELRAFELHCPSDWWPLFATLFYTGARLGEAQGLRGADVLMSADRITLHEGHRRLKTSASTRDVPLGRQLKGAFAVHLARLSPGPADLVFPNEFQNYEKLRRAWDRTCRNAGIHDATPNDARHTFGVHAAQAGVPLVRLQKLMGHASPIMTMRYMKHAPEAYLAEDGAAIAEHMTASSDAESEARSEAARSEVRSA